MADEHWTPLLPQRIAKPAAREQIYDFVAGGHAYRCELTDRGAACVEATILQDGELFDARTFHRRFHIDPPARDAAIHWANAAKQQLERG